MSIGSIIYYSVLLILFVAFVVLLLVLDAKLAAREYDLYIDGDYYERVHNVKVDYKRCVVRFTDLSNGEWSVSYENLLMVSLPNGGDHE